MKMTSLFDTWAVKEALSKINLAEDKMDPELKARWTAALRSGKYEQGNEYLCKTTADGVQRFCCLGVLADIQNLRSEDNNVPVGDGHPDPTTQITSYKTYELDEDGILTEDYLVCGDIELFGLSLSTQQNLAELNDGGKTFSEIADIIDAEL